MALLLGLVVYTGAYIAEIVRAGILAVPERAEGSSARTRPDEPARRCASSSSRRRARHHPAADLQYLNLTKNSSLGVAIAYPDLVSVFAGTMLNQTGQAVDHRAHVRWASISHCQPRHDVSS